MTTALESARAHLSLAQRNFAEVSPDLNARLDAASSLPEVEAIEREIATAEAPVTEARKRVETLERIDSARSNMAGLIPGGDTERVTIGSEPTTYQRGNPYSPSFFSDLYKHQRSSNPAAAERLQRGSKETLVLAEEKRIVYRDAEGRAMSSTGGSGGDFLPPLYFGDLFAEYKRARRVTANLVRNLPLAAKGNSITIPRFTGGTTTAAQTSDNQNVSNTDATTAIITIPVCTVAGYTDLSRQIVERSDPPMDELILEDLLHDYNKKVNNYVVNGSGASGQPKGIFAPIAFNLSTYTDASPTVAALYPVLTQAKRNVEQSVFENCTAIIMTSRRWNWFLAAVDTTNRPLVVPDGNSFNSVATLNVSADAYGAEGAAKPVGTLLGLPVYVDETLPKTQGVGTNQDSIILGAFNESILWEDQNGPRRFVFEGVTSQTAAIRVQVFGYCAFTAERFPTSISVVEGTGLVAPA